MSNENTSTKKDQKQDAKQDKAAVQDAPAFEIAKDGAHITRRRGLTLVNYPGERA